MATADRHIPRQRLDTTLVERGLAETRVRAQAIIIGGGVMVGGSIVTKPGTPVGLEAIIELVSPPSPYVSRGAIKLKRALDVFHVNVANAATADVGASTGGFTEVLLEAGAARVYAIDVGYGQLAWRLRIDPRVVVMERTNIRNLESLPEPIKVVVVDVSFISLRLILPRLKSILSATGQAIILIKPQFEAGRTRVGKKGVVRDPNVWREVLCEVLSFARQSGWAVAGLTRSPIRGPAGNVEFFAYLKTGNTDALLDLATAIDEVVGAED